MGMKFKETKLCKLLDISTKLRSSPLTAAQTWTAFFSLCFKSSRHHPALCETTGVQARGEGCGYSPKTPIRVNAAQRGHDFGTTNIKLGIHFLENIPRTGYNISNERAIKIY